MQQHSYSPFSLSPEAQAELRSISPERLLTFFFKTRLSPTALYHTANFSSSSNNPSSPSTNSDRSPVLLRLALQSSCAPPSSITFSKTSQPAEQILLYTLYQYILLAHDLPSPNKNEKFFWPSPTDTSVDPSVATVLPISPVPPS